MVEWTQEGRLLLVGEEEKKELVTVHVADTSSGAIIHSLQLKGRGVTSLCVCNDTNSVALARSMVILLQPTDRSVVGRLVDVLNMDTLEIQWSFTAKGSGSIKSFIFEKGDKLIIPSDNGKITIWQRDQILGELHIPSGNVYYMGRASEDRLWISSEVRRPLISLIQIEWIT